MDITDWFQPKQKVKKVSKKARNIIKLKKVYLGILGALTKKEVIDLLELSHMKKFLQSGGTLTEMNRYNQIMRKITNNSSVSDDIKNKLLKICKKLYSHLYDIIQVDKANGGIDLCMDTIISGIVEHNTQLKFTKDQLQAIKNICVFLYNHKMRTYGLYGYAGTGKTTTFIKLVHYMLYNNYIKSICFAAPTNKAVNVMKAKFQSDIDDLFKRRRDRNDGLYSQLDTLETKGLTITFSTIHKLMNYKIDVDVEGNRVFIKGKKSNINRYDLVIIDECSMIQMKSIINIFSEIQRITILQGKNNTDMRVPKILFVGDPSQLPPVNEKSSIIFATDKKDFNLKYLKKMAGPNINYKEIISDIINQQSITLKQVVRSNNNRVIKLCNNIRSWVFGEEAGINITKYKGKKVIIYKKDNKDKTKTAWFKKSVEYFKKKNENVSIIILTWTNKASDKYNNKIRELLFNKTTLNKIEINDILILNDYYNYKEKEVKKKYDAKDNKRFYTSEQIKVTDMEEVIKVCPMISVTVSNTLRSMKNSASILGNLKKVTVVINKKAKRRYSVYKIFVHKLTEIKIKDIIPEVYQMYVIKDKSVKQLEDDKNFVSSKIRELRNHYNIFHKEQMNTIDKEIIKPLWRSYNESFVDPFANVNYGGSCSVHKSQASTYYNVFVDMDDILKNRNINEGKRCLYTAITRVSNEVHILL